MATGTAPARTKRVEPSAVSGGWLRVPAVVALCVLLLWISVGSTANFVLAQGAPGLALRWWPMGAEAQTGLAAGQLAPGAPAAIAETRALAARALTREPVLAPAASTLGLADTAAGDLPAADRAFAYAEHLSRRELPTETWLIQRCVDQGDVAGALRHYDLALRTNTQSYDALLPILAAASANAPVRTVLIPYLVHGAPWRQAYANQLASTGTDPGSLFAQVRAMRLDRAGDDGHLLLAKAIQRLVTLDSPLLAARLAGVHASGLRDGSFDAPGGFPPFDWWLNDDPDLSAAREPREGAAGDALHITASGERGGEVAHQLLLLAAGHYRLGGNLAAASDKAATLLFSVACAKSGSALLSARVAPAAGRFAADFYVPSDCSAQWLRIAGPPATNVDAWLDDLSIAPLAASTAR